MKYKQEENKVFANLSSLLSFRREAVKIESIFFILSKNLHKLRIRTNLSDKEIK